MTFEVLHPESVTTAYQIISALYIFGMAFSLRQKKALDARDNSRCQAPFKHEHKGALHRHHILPQGYCLQFKIDPDFAMNGIVICENAHIKTLHPDAAEAKQNFRKGDKKAFEKLRTERHDKLIEKVPYWKTEHDRALHAIAVRNTQKAERKGWKWPLNSHQKSDIDDSYKP